MIKEVRILLDTNLDNIALQMDLIEEINKALDSLVSAGQRAEQNKKRMADMSRRIEGLKVQKKKQKQMADY